MKRFCAMMISLVLVLLMLSGCSALASLRFTHYLSQGNWAKAAECYEEEIIRDAKAYDQAIELIEQTADGFVEQYKNGECKFEFADRNLRELLVFEETCPYVNESINRINLIREQEEALEEAKQRIESGFYSDGLFRLNQLLGNYYKEGVIEKEIEDAENLLVESEIKRAWESIEDAEGYGYAFEIMTDLKLSLPERKEIQTTLDEMVVQYVDTVCARLSDEIEKEDFDCSTGFIEQGNQSIDILKETTRSGSEYEGQCQRITDVLVRGCTKYAQKVLDEASALIKEDSTPRDYEHAYTMLVKAERDDMNALGVEYKPEDYRVKRIEYYNKCVEGALQEAEEYADMGNYRAAMSRVEDTWHVTHDDSLKKKYYEYEEYLPINLNEVEPSASSKDYNSGYMWGTLEDIWGNKSMGNPCVSCSSASSTVSGYVEYALSGKHKYFTATVSRSVLFDWEHDYQIPLRFKIYADGQMVYQSHDIWRNDKPFDIRVDIGCASILRIEAEGTGASNWVMFNNAWLTNEEEEEE